MHILIYIYKATLTGCRGSASKGKSPLTISDCLACHKIIKGQQRGIMSFRPNHEITKNGSKTVLVFNRIWKEQRRTQRNKQIVGCFSPQRKRNRFQELSL